MRELIIIFFAAAVLTQVNAAVNCTSAGRFADTSDTTCQNYTLCVYASSTSSYIAYNYTCPTTSVFNPDTSLCTDPSNYTCNNTAADATNTTNTTSVCTEDGYVADSSSTNCTTYIQCVEINATFTETTLTCPNNTYYNPNTTLCESDYVCETNTTSTFTCTAAGRFADTSVSGCQSYYMCVYDSSTSEYIEYTYTCPSTSVFNPTTSVCTTNYTCTT